MLLDLELGSEVPVITVTDNEDSSSNSMVISSAPTLFHTFTPIPSSSPALTRVPIPTTTSAVASIPTPVITPIPTPTPTLISSSPSPTPSGSTDDRRRTKVKGKKRAIHDNSNELMEAALVELRSSGGPNKFTAFGQSVANDLESFEHEQAIIAKKIINEAMFLGALGKLTINSTVKTE